ncbi:P2Y purinoceptor 14-like [Poecilia reticulata]|uniref:P2Y purinoceptor 14-like n=1 Tax=Poecilia reticulata TaxID=8081 RepID=UPI0004A26964|nr:PREDICTED: P2Y purinoceptor 14-like [Poecilia reticulata]XP_017163777.1 PREDICTED: P2Y purinoceptor 14-like [Poecilia reticulata]
MADPVRANSSGTGQNKTCDSVETSYHPFLLLIYCLLFLVGLIFNSFTLWFHCRGAHGQASKSWMIYLKHLTAADFLLCVSLPLRIVHYARNSYTIHLLYCSVGAPLLFINMTASILFMSYIAANRYMKIFYSSGTHFLMSAKASRIISMTTWVVLLTTITPYAILMLINRTSQRSDHGTCGHLLKELMRPLYTASHAVAFIIFLSGLFSLVFFYYSASRRVLQVQQTQPASSNSKKLVKSRRNMLVLVSVFCFCFVPHYIVRIPYIILQGQCSVVMYYVKEVAVLLSVFNIILDPLIYVFLCKEFRAQLNLKQIFCIKGNRNISSSEAGDSENQMNTISTSVAPRAQ